MKNPVPPALAAVVLAAVNGEPAAAQAPAQFAIIRDGNAPIGHHNVAFSRDADGNLVAQIEIEIAVRLAFVTVFRYSHRSREVWRNDRLVALDTETNDDGTRMTVRARATADGLEVVGPHGRAVLPADIRTTSWWRADTIRQRQLLDSADGRVIAISATAAGTATRNRNGQTAQVTMWSIAAVGGFSDIAIGYTQRGEWAAMHFRSRGSRIDYAEPGATPASMLTR